MTILEIIQDVCSELSLPRHESVVGNTDLTIRQLLAQAHDDIDQMRRALEWPELQKEATITLVDGQASYALPGDYYKQVSRTHWDLNNQWELVGPLTAQEWQYYKSGIVGIGIRRRFRVKGSTTAQVFIDPTPDSSDAGQELRYEYISKSCVRPKTWVTGTTFLAGSFCFYNGNIYTTTAGGVSGVTAPTHTSSNASDGGIDWEFYSEPYTKYRADTDLPLLDPETHKKGIRWRWLDSKGMASATQKYEHAVMMQQAATNLKGARTLNLAGGRDGEPPWLGLENIPDHGYGS